MDGFGHREHQGKLSVVAATNVTKNPRHKMMPTGAIELSPSLRVDQPASYHSFDSRLVGGSLRLISSADVCEKSLPLLEN